MSYEPPFSKPAGWSYKTYILLGLLALHAIWIVVHLNLVSRELINPWKVGGYGMYTTVHPYPVVHVFDTRFDSFAMTIPEDDLLRLSRANRSFVFRCQPMTISSLKEFLKGNPKLIGLPLRFVLTELKMLRDPIRMERLPHAILEIRWTGPETFDYAGKVCGKIYRGDAELKS